MSNPEDRFAPPPRPGLGGFDAPTAAVPVVPAPTVPSTPPPPENRGSSGTKTASLAFLATLVAAGIVAAAFFFGQSRDEASPVTTALPATTTTGLISSTTTVPATTAPPVTAAPIGDVRQAPAGLLCRDLEAQGYSYSASVDYWRVNGQPDRMDADKNGIPCETVYPRSDVVAYWPAATYEVSVSYGLPSGLLCRDLEARGVGVYDALRYYIWEGSPSRMDADGNGIPCETVYSDAAAVWLYEF
jgi:hypothetical protein